MPTGSYTNSCVEAEYSAGALSAICAGPFNQVKVPDGYEAGPTPPPPLLLTGRKTLLTVAGDAQGIQNCNGWLTTHKDCSQTSESKDLGMWCREVTPDLKNSPREGPWPLVYGPWRQSRGPMDMSCQ